MISELGVYLVPGRAEESAEVYEQARVSEKLGFGSVWLSERLDTKEIGSLSGAVGAVTSQTEVAVGLTHIDTRHPLVLAALGTTMQSLTQGRFLLGLGKGLGSMAPALGLPKPSLDRLEHIASILRRLWKGERISESGPAGDFRSLKLVDMPEQPPPPLLFGTINRRGLALAGRVFDGVILHPFLTVETVARSVEIVRTSAARAGRDPADVKIYACLVMAPDMPDERVGIAVYARAVTYFQAPRLGEGLVRANRWSGKQLGSFRANRLFEQRGGTADYGFRRSELADVGREALPQEWIDTGCSVGTAEHCVEFAREFLDVGADGIIVHGALPSESATFVNAWSSRLGSRSAATTT